VVLRSIGCIPETLQDGHDKDRGNVWRTHPNKFQNWLLHHPFHRSRILTTSSSLVNSNVYPGRLPYPRRKESNADFGEHVAASHKLIRSRCWELDS